MAVSFEGAEKRGKKIEETTKKYGLKDLEEAKALFLKHQCNYQYKFEYHDY